jgi:hypothetical protein
MKSAYRVLAGRFPAVDKFVTQETAANVPITDTSSVRRHVISGRRTLPQGARRRHRGHRVGRRAASVMFRVNGRWPIVEARTVGHDYGRRSGSSAITSDPPRMACLIMARAFNRGEDNR